MENTAELTIDCIAEKLTGKSDFFNLKSDFSKLERQLVFIAEMDKMKNILRRTLITDSSRRENDAEHSWHIALMAVILEEYAAKPVNMSRVLSMLVIHDLIEVYAGDTFAFDVEANMEKESKEKVAADKLFSILSDEQGIKLRSLWEEFDAMNTDDSIFAASLDRLQPFIHNTLTNGHTWKIGKVKKEQVYKRMEPVKKGLPCLWGWVEQQIQTGIDKGLILS